VSEELDDNFDLDIDTNTDNLVFVFFCCSQKKSYCWLLWHPVCILKPPVLWYVCNHVIICIHSYRLPGFRHAVCVLGTSVMRFLSRPTVLIFLPIVLSNTPLNYQKATLLTIVKTRLGKISG
jgi:hypothetical protein